MNIKLRTSFVVFAAIFGMLLNFKIVVAQPPEYSAKDSIKIALKFFRDRFNINDIQGLMKEATDAVNEYPEPVREMIISDLKEIDKMIPPNVHMLMFPRSINIHNNHNATVEMYYKFLRKSPTEETEEAFFNNIVSGTITLTFVKPNDRWKAANLRGFVNHVKNIIKNLGG